MHLSTRILVKFVKCFKSCHYAYHFIKANHYACSIFNLNSTVTCVETGSAMPQMLLILCHPTGFTGDNSFICAWQAT